MRVSFDTWIQAQQSVLGSCLIDDRAASHIVFGLCEQDFCESYRSLYRAIRELYTTGKPVDPVTVVNVVGDEYRSVVLQLMEVTPTAANAKHYVQICREQSRIMQLRDIGQKLMVVDSGQDGEELLKLAAHHEVQQDDDTWSLSDALSNWYTRYQQKPDYLEWFAGPLRRKIRAERGDYWILGGRPSDGKSAFAMQCAIFWSVVCRKRVGFFSHETSREKLTDRLIACAAGIPLDGLKERTLTDQQCERASIMAAKINAAPLYLIKAAGKTVDQMQDRALHNHYDIIIVDYLQIVTASGDSEYAQVTNISKALHVMCQNFGITCLALCQLSRTRGARPGLEDLRSSGQLEQDADGVLFLHKLAEPGEPRELIIAKNKDGELGSTKLWFEGGCQQFQYLGRGSQPVKAYDYCAEKYYRPEISDGMENYEIVEGDDPDFPFGK